MAGVMISGRWSRVYLGGITWLFTLTTKVTNLIAVIAWVDRLVITSFVL